MFRLLSVASALPQQRKTNDDLSLFLDTSDEWISQRTGIRERAVCVEESLTELLVAAAKEALVRAQLSAQQIDLILCATIRGDYITPSQACVVQRNWAQAARRWILELPAPVFYTRLMWRQDILPEKSKKCFDFGRGRHVQIGELAGPFYLRTVRRCGGSRGVD